MHLLTSINHVDDLLKHESLYYKESLHLLKIIKQVQHNKGKCLCLIDELLSGTNSVERIIASEEIIKYISSFYPYVVFTTHNQELVHALEEQLEAYCFSDEIIDNQLHFSYKLQRGVSYSTNAIKLLEYLEYPSIITDNSFNKLKVAKNFNNK